MHQCDLDGVDLCKVVGRNSIVPTRRRKFQHRAAAPNVAIEKPRGIALGRRAAPNQLSADRVAASEPCGLATSPGLGGLVPSVSGRPELIGVVEQPTHVRSIEVLVVGIGELISDVGEVEFQRRLAARSGRFNRLAKASTSAVSSAPGRPAARCPAPHRRLATTAAARADERARPPRQAAASATAHPA